ncbi:hypothetical protein [Ferruginibacter sp.]|nr:hypothetical protein [Ferruginibacter sp.]
MKVRSIILFAAVLFCVATQAQTPTANATNVISTLRMGPFKINSCKADIEKIMTTKLVAIDKDDYYDTVKVVYNNSNYTLVFSNEYNEDPKAPLKMRLVFIISTNTSLKTKSGIGLGSTKAQILSAYDKFDINIYNDYQYKEKKNPKDKIQLVTLQDFDAGTQIMFTTENRVVTQIMVGIYEGE